MRQPHKINEIKAVWKRYLESHEPEYFQHRRMEAIHDEAFNGDYFVTGTREAEQWLGDHAPEVIRTVESYEDEDFGEVFTDLSDARQVVNRYVYIIGGQVAYDWADGHKPDHPVCMMDTKAVLPDANMHMTLGLTKSEL